MKLFRSISTSLRGLWQAGDARHAARVTAASIAAYVLATSLGLPQGYWSVISAIIVVQSSIGGTMVAAQERVFGTVLGAAAGGLAAFLRPPTPEGVALALGCALAFTAFFAARRPALRVAPVTAAILVLATASADGSLRLAFERVTEILLGGFIGVIITLTVFPARANHGVLKQCRQVAALLADVHGGTIRRTTDEAAEQQWVATNARIRATLAAVEKSVGEARREDLAGTYNGLRAALVRTLWRVRNDVVGMGTTLPDELLHEADNALAACVHRLIGLQAACLRTCGEPQGPSPEMREELAAETKKLGTLIDRLRTSTQIDNRSFSEIAALAHVIFVLQTLSRDLIGLADRMGEVANRSRPATDKPIIADQSAQLP